MSKKPPSRPSHAPPRLSLLVLAAFVLAVLPAIACRKSEPETGSTPAATAARPSAAPKGAHFAWAGAEPRTLDPAFASDTPSVRLLLNLFEGLLVFPPGDGEPRPGVALSYALSQDGRTYRFRLRETARWSDGEPVTAEDFVFAWRRVLDPAVGSPGARDLWMLAGARSFNEGTTTDPTTVGVSAAGPHELIVRLEQPDPLFPQHLVTSRFLPVPRHVVTKHGRQWTRQAALVTNGAFRLARWLPGERLELVRSETYWGRDTVRLASAELRVTESEAVALRWFEAGEVHYTPGLIPHEVLLTPAVERPAALRLDPCLGVFYVAFQLRRPPFDDRRVRQAFQLAVDRDALVLSALRGGQRPATHFVPDLFGEATGYEPPPSDGYDPARARELLDEAGYPGGQGFPEVTLIFNTSETMARIMAFLADELRRHLGVKVTLRQQEWKSYLARVRSGEFELARYGLQGGVDPMDYLSILRTDGANNIGGYTNANYDALLDRVRAEPDRAARLRAMAAAEAVLVADTPVLPLYFYACPAMLDPAVEGFVPNARDRHLLRYLAVP